MTSSSSDLATGWISTRKNDWNTSDGKECGGRRKKPAATKRKSKSKSKQTASSSSSGGATAKRKRKRIPPSQPSSSGSAASQDSSEVIDLLGGSSEEGEEEDNDVDISDACVSFVAGAAGRRKNSSRAAKGSAMIKMKRDIDLFVDSESGGGFSSDGLSD